MNNQDEREMFERWWGTEDLECARLAWATWQAARAIPCPACGVNRNAAAILNNPQALHLHLLRNGGLSRANLRHLLGDDPTNTEG